MKVIIQNLRAHSHSSADNLEVYFSKTRRNEYDSDLKNNQVLQEANWYYQKAEKKKIGWTNATNAKHADKAL